MGNKGPAYTSADALIDLGGKPDDTELERLKKYYPSYSLIHRIHILQGMFDGSSLDKLVLDKLTALEHDGSIIKQSRGGHTRWAVIRVRNSVMRLLYLRYRLDEGMTQRQANQLLVKRLTFSKAKDGGQSTIRKITTSVLLDGGVI